MNTKHLNLSLLIATTVLTPGISVYAQTLEQNLPNLDYCRTVRQQAAQRSASSSYTDASVDTDFSMGLPNGLGVNANGDGDYYNTTSSSSSSQSSYNERDCDEALRAAGEVTVAQVKANRDVAVAVINGKFRLEEVKILADTTKYVTDSNNATQRYVTDSRGDAARDIAKTQARANTTSTIVGAVGSLIGNTITSSGNRRQQKLEAEVEREKIAANNVNNFPAIAATNASSFSPLDQLLAQWQLARIACFPGAVFINGLISETVCVSPNAALPAGQYAYDQARNQIFLVNYPSQPNSMPVYNSVEPPSYSSDSSVNSGI